MFQKLSLRYSILLAVVSGVVTAFVFPTMIAGTLLPNFGFLAWFSLIPLFVAISNASPRRAFGLTFITGFILYSCSLYWLYNALTEYGKLSPLVTVAILFLMMVILGAYLAIAPLWVTWIRSKLRAHAFYLLPVAWVTVELARNCFPAGGFPWNNIAYSQAGYPVIIQTADLFSVYGVTFLIIMVNQLLAGLIVGWGDFRKAHTVLKSVAVFILFVLVLAYGWYRLETIESRSVSSRTVRMALVQGNIAQDEKWDDEMMEKNLGVYKKYMDLIVDGDARLIIWPEAAYPYIVPLEAGFIRADILGLDEKKRPGPYLLFGALSSELTAAEGIFYNSAILVNSSGKILDRYHKLHLVPFGEYVPFKKALFFVDKLVEPIGEFRAGAEYRPLEVGDFKVAPLICYEDVFPEISRRLVKNGAGVLINMTNDAWYGRTSAAYQHLAISAFRAIENRRYMLRATNTGVSAVIDQKGRVELESRLFFESLIVTGVPVLSGETVYDKVGNLFAYFCVVVVVLMSAVGCYKYRSAKSCHKRC